MPTSSSSWRNSTLKLYVLVFRNHLSYLQEQFSESCLTATNPIPHSLLCLLFAKKKKSGRGTGQKGTEKSNSAFSCLRFLELHVADEQLNNQEKAQFPLGSRVKLPSCWWGSAPVHYQILCADFGQVYHWPLCASATFSQNGLWHRIY